MQGLSDQGPDQRFGVDNSHVCFWPNRVRIVRDALECFPRHGLKLGTGEIAAEIGFRISRTDVTHDATQVAEIVDAQNHALRPKNQVTRHRDFIESSKMIYPAEHLGACDEMNVKQNRNLACLNRPYVLYRVNLTQIPQVQIQ